MATSEGYYIYGCRNPIALSRYNDYDFNVDDKGYVVVYTDGACLHNGQPYAKGGVGAYFGPGHYLNISKPLDPSEPCTNNVAEIYALIEAVSAVKKCGVNQLAIYTDSKYIIECLTKWIPKWKQNNWIGSKGYRVINELQYKKLLGVIGDMNIKLVHVDAHSGIPGNEAAHDLAQQAAQRYISD